MSKAPPNLSIPAADIKYFQAIIDGVKSIAMTGSQVVSSFATNKIFLDAARAFLSYDGIESFRSTTYHDQPAPNGDLTIGVGFDLEPKIAKTILQSLAVQVPLENVYVKDTGVPPKYNDGWADGQPDPQHVPSISIRKEQFDAIFRILLVNDPPVPGWYSKGQQLQDILTNNGLGDTAFTGPEVIAMLSLVYQEGEKLFGPGLITAIKFYKQGGDPLSVVSQLVECSNREKSVGISNRRLCEAALFASATLTPDRIVLPYRQQQQILATQGLSQVASLHPLPLRDYPKQYVPQATTRVLEGCGAALGGNDVPEDAIILGGSTDAYLTGSAGSTVVLAGARMTTIVAPPSTAGVFPYYVGSSQGITTFRLPALSGQMRLFSMNAQDQLVHDGVLLEGIVLEGLLRQNGHQYYFKFLPEAGADGEDTGVFPTLALTRDQDNANVILMSAYTEVVDGFNLRLRTWRSATTNPLYGFGGTFTVNGRYVIGEIAQKTTTYTLFLCTYDLEGHLLKNETLEGFPFCGFDALLGCIGGWTKLLPTRSGVDVYTLDTEAQVLYQGLTPIFSALPGQVIYFDMCKPDAFAPYVMVYGVGDEKTAPDLCPTVKFNPERSGLPIWAQAEVALGRSVVRSVFTYLEPQICGPMVIQSLMDQGQEQWHNQDCYGFMIPPVLLPGDELVLGFAAWNPAALPPMTMASIYHLARLPEAQKRRKVKIVPPHVPSLIPLPEEKWSHCITLPGDEDNLWCESADQRFVRHIQKLPTYLSAEIPRTDHYDFCESLEEGKRHCVGKYTEFTEYDRARWPGVFASFSSSLYSMLGGAILWGALSAAAPEAIGDGLTLLGVAEENSAKAKAAVRMLLWLLMGAILASVTGIIVRLVLQKCGCSEKTSSKISTAVVTGLNWSSALTPSGLALSAAATASGYAGAYIGLWAQKRLMRRWVGAAEYKEVPQGVLVHVGAP